MYRRIEDASVEGEPAVTGQQAGTLPLRPRDLSLSCHPMMGWRTAAAEPGLALGHGLAPESALGSLLRGYLSSAQASAGGEKQPH